MRSEFQLSRLMSSSEANMTSSVFMEIFDKVKKDIKFEKLTKKDLELIKIINAKLPLMKSPAG